MPFLNLDPANDIGLCGLDGAQADLGAVQTLLWISSCSIPAMALVVGFAVFAAAPEGYKPTSDCRWMRGRCFCKNHARVEAATKANEAY